MLRTKPALTVIFSVLAMTAVLAGVWATMSSPLFVVRVLEVSDQPADAPLDSSEITEMAAVPLGGVNLFRLELDRIKQRLLENHWVRDVILTKRFPQTLSVQVIYRQPVALLQGAHGVLQFIDADGSLFGPVTLRGRSDLPLVHGLPDGDVGDRLRLEAIRLIRAWEAYSWRTVNQLSQVSWDEEEGFTAWFAFSPSYRISAILGPGADLSGMEAVLSRIDRVLMHSLKHSLPVRQIFADANKKIVVRTARRS